MKHGLTRKHPLYRVWSNMKTRCNNPSSEAYKYYGGRGIEVCKEWSESFLDFYNWSLKNGWKPGLEIDRKNNNGNYEPGNCRFVTTMINSRNKTSNRVITFAGESKLLCEWAEILNVNPSSLGNRLKRMSIFEAFTKGKLSTKNF